MEAIFLTKNLTAYTFSHEEEKKELAKDEKIQQAMVGIRQKFGKNAVLKGTSLEDGATGKERNMQIGGHKG